MSWASLTPASTAVRTDTTPGSASLNLVELSLSWSWGAQPATATMTYTGQFLNPADSINTGLSYVAPVGAYAELVIRAGPSEVHRFHGVIVADQGVDAAQGKDRVLQFRDLREFLAWDTVFGAFNLPDTVSFLEGGGVRKRRRWRHLLPADWATNQYSFTDAPLSAAEICDLLFGSDTVESPWVRHYHPDMATTPAFGIDLSSGATLAAAITQVCEPIGVVFTLYGKWILRFRRKGELLTAVNAFSPIDDNMPWASSPFPLNGTGNPVWPLTMAGQPAADQVRDGLLVTSNPTRVRVVGDRNLYQILNLTLVPDWAPGWEEFWDEQVFLNWVYHHVESQPGVTFEALPSVNAADPENVIGWQLAVARASELTVADVASLREVISSDGGQFLDHRLFGGQARLQMPALLYLRSVLWRAYRLPASLLGRPATAFQLVDRQLIGVTHDAAGVMSVAEDQPLDGAGYVIAQGVGFQSQTALRALNPDRFNLAEWVTANTRWSVQNFGVDPDGGDGIGFIVLDAPVFLAEDAFVAIASGDLSLGVAKAAPVIEPAVVKAALTLAGEKYVFTWPATPPSQQKDAVQNEPGLHAERVHDASGPLLCTIDYADDQTVDQKAELFASSFLVRQWTYRVGGYQRILQDGDTGVRLNGMLDRVSMAAGPGGVTESVDFTGERSANDFVPDRFYERSLRDADLFQGQRELRQQSRESRSLAAALKANPGFVGTLVSGFHDLIGGGPVVPGKIIPDSPEATPLTLPAGAPLWRRPTETTAVLPAEVGSQHSVLLGVTVREGESSNDNLPLASSGRVLIRVHGGASGVAVGDVLGRASAADHLSPTDSGGVAVARATVPAGTTRLVWCDIGSGSGSSPADPESIPDTVYWGTGVTGPRITSLAQLRNLGFSEERSDFLRPSGYDIGFNPAGDTYGFFAFPDSFGSPIAFEIPGLPLSPSVQTMAGGTEGYGAHEENGLRYDKLTIGGVPYRIYRTPYYVGASNLGYPFTVTRVVRSGGIGPLWAFYYDLHPLILEGTYSIALHFAGGPVGGFELATFTADTAIPEERSFPADDLTQFGAPNNLVGTTFVLTSRGSTDLFMDTLVDLVDAGDWGTQPALISSVGYLLAMRWYISATQVETPTFSPVAGDYGSYPMDVGINSATAGAGITYKITAVADPDEPVTPGLNGWSELEPGPVTVSVVEGDQIRAQARKPSMAASALATASCT